MSKHLHIHVHDSAYTYNGTFNKKDVPVNGKKHHSFTYNGVFKRTDTTKTPDSVEDECDCMKVKK